jgi:hypothetical protein
MDSDEATALNKRYCDRKQELKEDFKPDDYNGMGIKRRMRTAARNAQAKWIRENVKLSDLHIN